MMKESLKKDNGPLVTCRGFPKSNESILAVVLVVTVPAVVVVLLGPLGTVLFHTYRSDEARFVVPSRAVPFTRRA